MLRADTDIDGAVGIWSLGCGQKVCSVDERVESSSW